jgi:hypothetical protein
MRLHQAAGALLDQRLQIDTVYQIERIEDITFRF